MCPVSNTSESIPEEYKYKNISITPSVIEELAVRLFNGTMNKRDAIIEGVLKFHIANGGLPPQAKDFDRSVNKALINLKLNGWAQNKVRGIWEIKKEDSPLIEQEPDEQDAAVEINDIPTHKIFGKGKYSIYLYYLNSYRRLAEMENKSSWACKIGRTERDPMIRILSQASTALPEKPTVEFIIRTGDSSLLESFIHSALKLRGKHIKDSPGAEWFETSPEEVIEILEYINPDILDH